jgi:serine/threonine protein kinase
MIGKIINNYIVERKLGDGGMGEVYYAKHNKVDREVAIKVLHSHLFSNESIHNRFKNEANALIKLNHPNIVKIFDYVEQENFACLIMEYINGYTLDDYISKISGPLSSEKVFSVICPVLEAVQYAHDNNVYHRDIKPANIMISKDRNEVRIMDFGIAKLTDSKNFKTTHANTQLGTPFYMSPEQIKGLPFSRRSDIYSLGVTLFEMVTGKCPYHGITSLFDLQSRIVNQPLPLTSEFYPGVSQRIQNAIAIATQKDPELRFQSCTDFINYLQENKVPSGTTTPNTSSRKQSENKIYWMAYLIAGFAILAVIIIASKIIGGKGEGHKKDPNTIEIAKTDTIIQSQNLNILRTYVTAMKTKSNVFFPPEENERLIKEIKKNDYLISDAELQNKYNSLFEKLLQDQNLNVLNIYISAMQEKSTVILTTKQKEKLINEVQKLDHLTSVNELHPKYDALFVVKPKPTFPTDAQITIDFWNSIHEKKYPCRVPFENDSQIPESEIRIDNSFRRINTPPNEISIKVNFTIISIDDESEKTSCSISLKYHKSGNEYQFTN